MPGCIQLEEGSDEDRLELPEQPYALALWNLIIRPPRRRYELSRLGPADFRLWSVHVRRVDIDLTNSRGLRLRCSHFLPRGLAEAGASATPRPVVIYLHQNASCRLEALQLVPLFLPLGIMLFSFDFAGCGESDGEYVSLGWHEREDLAKCIEYLRSTGKVSSIGLWGRSMGAVTALMHADRDHTIGGMVLDSPFSNLSTLVSELAQSEYLAVKVPDWLLSVALAFGRMRIRSLCDFDIEELTPEEHVGDSFVPALFVHGRDDDFVQPHHSQKLHEAYNGDKELELVEGDHNSPRPSAMQRKAVLFFCRALRVDPEPQTTRHGNLLRALDLESLASQSMFDYIVPSRRLIFEVASKLAVMGSLPPSTDSRPRLPPWLGERQQVYMPIRAENALQLSETSSEAGFCVSLMPQLSEWGGSSRPPEVLVAYAAADGLHIARASERGREALMHAPCALDLSVPILCILELRPNPARLRLSLGTGGPEVVRLIGEECEPEVSVWLWDSQLGDTQFFECAFADLSHSFAEREPSGGIRVVEADVREVDNAFAPTTDGPCEGSCQLQ